MCIAKNRLSEGLTRLTHPGRDGWVFRLEAAVNPTQCEKLYFNLLKLLVVFLVEVCIFVPTLFHHTDMVNNK